jgi:hypothetical protein
MDDETSVRAFRDPAAELGFHLGYELNAKREAVASLLDADMRWSAESRILVA